MIFYDRDTINQALELNDNIQFEIIEFDDGVLVNSSEIFKNYEKFLELYSSFPVLPSSEFNNKNMFMVQKFPSIIRCAFLKISKLCVENILPNLQISNISGCRGNVGRYDILKSRIFSIFPHVDSDSNYNLVCNYWVNVSTGDGTQFWKCDKIKNNDDISKYVDSQYDSNLIKDWYNIQETDDLKKTYFCPAKNNTCIFYFSNLLHSPVINEDNNLRCSIVSWYDLKDKNEN